MPRDGARDGEPVRDGAVAPLFPASPGPFRQPATAVFYRRSAVLASVFLLATLTLTLLTSQAMAQTPPPARPHDPWWFYSQNPGPLTQWRIEGSIGTHWEYYDAWGDKTQSPYPTLGLQPYSELHLNLSRRISPWELIRINVAGALNFSDYRDADNEGFIAERATIFWQKGDGAVPFRLRIGDFYSFLSLRTFQQNLKGAHIELQPDVGGPVRQIFGESARHSVILFGGLTNPIYREFGQSKEAFGGASWLITRPGTGRLAFNVVYGWQQADMLAGTPALHQTVFSVGAARDFAWGSHRIAFEGEAAGGVADLTGASGAIRHGQPGSGIYMALTGRDEKRPVDWSLRFEQYGQNYAPRGAATSPDRRSVEARLGWRFRNGLYLSGRFLRYQDDWEQGNRLDTWLAGVNLTGPFNIDGWPIRGLTGTLDAFVQEQASEDGTTADRTVKVAWDLTAPIDKLTTGRIGLFYSDVDSWVTGGVRVITKELSLGFDRAITYRRYSGVVSPGVVLRKITGSGADMTQYGPTLTASLAGDGHGLSVSYAFLLIDGHTAASSNTWTHTVGVQYSYTTGPHRFSIGFDYSNQVSDPGGDVNGYKVAFSYTYSFRRAPVTQTVPTGPRQPGRPVSRVLDLAALSPGLTLTEAQTRLRAAGVRGGVQRGGLIIYETRLFPRIGRRQRLVLVTRNGRLQRAVVIIDLGDASDVRGVERTYTLALETLLRRYGTPATTQIGAFDQTWRQALAAGRFVRAADWTLRGGARLRLGIPRRLDRQVRLEIHVAPGFPSPRNPRWGLDQVQ